MNVWVDPALLGPAGTGGPGGRPACWPQPYRWRKCTVRAVYFQRPQWVPCIVIEDPVVRFAPDWFRAHTLAAAKLLWANARRNIFLRIGSPSFTDSSVSEPSKVA